MTFSIITICYNSEKTIERTLKSVLNQSYKDYEYIIVDGASSDSTNDIVKKYEPLFEGRMKWQSEPDKGIYNAMNKGIKRATGTIVGIVNSDDWLEPNALSVVFDAYNQNNRDKNTLYCGGINYCDISGKVKQMPVNYKAFKRQVSLYVMSGIRHPATFVPMDVYMKIGLFNEKMKLSADQDFVLRCYYGGVSFCEINHILSNMAGGGISTDGSQASLEASIHDRKIMLSEFGFRGFKFYWLYYSWRLKLLIIKTILAK